MIGSCSLDDVAVRVLTRVIGHCPHRNQLLIDCGWAGLRYLRLFGFCFNQSSENRDKVESSSLFGKQQTWPVKLILTLITA